MKRNLCQIHIVRNLVALCTLYLTNPCYKTHMQFACVAKGDYSQFPL